VNKQIRQAGLNTNHIQGRIPDLGGGSAWSLWDGSPPLGSREEAGDILPANTLEESKTVFVNLVGSFIQ